MGALTNENVKTLVVGDMHLKEELVLPRVDAAVQALGAKRVVLCGDYVDEWCSSTLTTHDALDYLAIWVKTQRRRGLTVDLVLGNHDAQYLLREPGPGTHTELYDVVANVLTELDVRAAATVGSSLVTHAGVTRGWAEANLDCTKGFDADGLCRQLNALLDSGEKQALRTLTQAGPGRGGAELPGPLWADQSELWSDPLPGLSQVVGHTPVDTIEPYQIPQEGHLHISCRLVFCDTMSLTSNLMPIGDGSMLLVEGKSVRAVTSEELDLNPWPTAISDWMDTNVLPFL